MQKKITLTDHRQGYPNNERPFTVKSLVNSTRFMVDQDLTKTEVDALCRDRLWTVTIQGVTK